MENPSISLSLVDLSNGYYIAKFVDKLDYDRALLGGPWVIGDHYLHVRLWTPNFEARIDVLPIWVRFPDLPIEYYEKRWLERAGNRIGNTLWVDEMTLLASRGKFAKVCVEILFPIINHYTNIFF